MADIPLLEHLTGAPLIIDAGAERLFEASVKHLVAHPDAPKLFGGPTASEDDEFWDPSAWHAAYRPYNVKDGTLQIPIMGVLLHRFPYQLGRWATGYQYIEKAMARGLADGNVTRIAYVHDSPGGEVAGCFELAEKIYDARSEKPSWAFAADSMYSASYALGSAAKGISVSSSGGVGSIGVVTSHVEYSEALKDMGIKVTFIYAGKHKVDGNAYEKLSADTQKRWQARIDKIYGVFASTVARNRGMEEASVRATEALTYDAEDGITVGLADRMGSLEDEMVIFSDGDETAEDEQMADVKQEVHEKAVADARAEGLAAGKTEGKAEGLAEGATGERARINGILASDEGKKRPKAAMSIAMKTGLTVEEASAALADMPEEKAEAPAPAAEEQGKKKTASHFEQAMGADAPEVGARTEEDETEKDGDKSLGILAAYGSQTGRKPKAAA
jgi:signal peptide peptidase SppA